MKQRDQAYEAFVDHLLQRHLLPGAFVTQRQLMELTGFPLGAIREMIPRLEADGLISTIAQRGLQVAAVDLRLVREAFQLREIVETTAIAHFARTAPDSLIAEQRALHEDIQIRAQQGVTEALLAEAQAIDWGFHDAIIAHMGNRLLTEVHRVNLIRIRVIMYERVAMSPEALPPAFGEHSAALAAVQRRDPAAAVIALRAHLDSSRARALGLDIIDENIRRKSVLRRKA